MPELLRAGGGRLGKDGSMARRLVPWIPLVWKLQLCFNGSSKAQEKAGLGKTRIYYGCGFQIKSQVLLCMNSGRRLTSRKRTKWQRVSKEKRCNKTGEDAVLVIAGCCSETRQPERKQRPPRSPQWTAGFPVCRVIYLQLVQV
ncbi:uncharacterized protein ACIBXB_017669 isoform 1-T1 [Morphnus guianensis]